MGIPVIGLPAYRAPRGGTDYTVPQAYCTAVVLGGGVPVLVPPMDGVAALRRAYSLLDGLLFAGGGDVAAGNYGAVPSDKLKLVDEERDRLELRLACWALQDRLPILAICRGVQLLNVAAGGTLIQDIRTEVPAALEHSMGREFPRSHVAHPVSVTPGSWLAELLGPPITGYPPVEKRDVLCYGVNSFHHQAVHCVAPGFIATAYAPDGVIEAIEPSTRSGFAVGVQWHPECMVPGDAAMGRLFRGFIDVCSRWAATCQRGEVYCGKGSTDG